MSHHASLPFSQLTISELRSETVELSHLSLVGAAPEFLTAYHTPGQYVQVRVGEARPGHYAIACGPGQGHIELLVKRGSPLNDAICEKKTGETLEVSAPAGKGYPLSLARGQDLVLVGVGSGIAPLRAVVHSVLDERAAYGLVYLLFGMRTRCAFPYQAEVDSWAGKNIEVNQVCSRPHAGTWSGHVGRVHEMLLAHRPVFRPETVVFACGMKQMIEDIKAAFVELGLPGERVYQNF